MQETIINNYKARFNTLLNTNSAEQLAIKCILLEDFIESNKDMYSKFKDTLLTRILYEEVV